MKIGAHQSIAGGLERAIEAARQDGCESVQIFTRNQNQWKAKPLSDEKLMKVLQDKGYKIARRTVAKYREQLGIPVARLRKEL